MKMFAMGTTTRTKTSSRPSTRTRNSAIPSSSSSSLYSNHNYDAQSTLLKQYMDSRNKSMESKNAGQTSVQAKSNSASSSSSSSLTNPPSTLTETESFIRLSMDLPGVARASDIAVDVQRGVLLIRGTRSIPESSTNTGTGKDPNAMEEDSEESRRALKKVKFVRRFALDTDVVDKINVKANFFKNVLVIMAPKKNQPSSIKVKVTENNQVEEDLAFIKDHSIGAIGGADGAGSTVASNLAANFRGHNHDTHASHNVAADDTATMKNASSSLLHSPSHSHSETKSEQREGAQNAWMVPVPPEKTTVLPVDTHASPVIIHKSNSKDNGGNNNDSINKTSEELTSRSK